MIKFSLQHIAEHAPYDLLLAGNDFMFQTDLGKHRFTIRQAHARIEGEGLFFCIVVDNRNPHLKAITADFEENAMLLAENKP